ncbi:carbohydrate kinase family protein [Lactonifactor longoviformis]|uniref:carbohydrate kinase family protein n=1 Tax=Lactonifactor longoviformis TaxID=341220 RepID=UPI001D01911C|nr:PfkB family carbohydrate kinase [Lactonifactor longoviformis]MCB5713762.1 PfkB family carbohydrate kinase [Lactonifactor longoviformis]MCB5717784.1 PfkB family carbohydrate kinase [Lactonifactor longoviformis]
MKFDKVVGTGGVGTGMLLLSPIQDTLGRSESRLVHMSSARDYCKLHIVFHYIAALIGKQTEVYPLSYVGQDTMGEELLGEMRLAGMHTEYMGRSEELRTMLSVCLQYPDKEGCNMTVINSAASRVTPEYIRSSMEALSVDANTLVAAIPEVSAESRIALLREGKERGAFCVLSVPAAEAETFLEADAFTLCDLLAVNEEEARAVLSAMDKEREGDTQESFGDELVLRLYEQVERLNPEIQLLVTFGKHGAYTMAGRRLEYLPAAQVSVKNTTGAGDAFLGGTITGLCLGLPLQKSSSESALEETELLSAAELGTFCAGLAVQCEDSIAWETEPGILDGIGISCTDIKTGRNKDTLQ